MPEYDNTNSGALFKNRDKDEAHPKWADYQGSINIEGTEYWLSAWLKESKKGEKFMSLSVKPKNQRASRPAQSAPAPDPGSDIPF